MPCYKALNPPAGGWKDGSSQGMKDSGGITFPPLLSPVVGNNTVSNTPSCTGTLVHEECIPNSSTYSGGLLLVSLHRLQGSIVMGGFTGTSVLCTVSDSP